MNTDIDSGEAMPIVRDPRNFDRASGNRLERLVFNFRLPFLALCALVTLVLVHVVSPWLLVVAGAGGGGAGHGGRLLSQGAGVRR